MSNWSLYSLDDGDMCFLCEARSADALKTKARGFRKHGYAFPFIIKSPHGRDTYRCDGETRTGKFQRWIWL